MSAVSAAEIIAVFLFGGIVAGILGYITQKINWARGRVGKYKSYQEVKQQTKETPIQVVKSSVAASFSCAFWTVVLILFLLLLAYLAYVYLSQA
jgi:hypothetical protein